MKKLGLFLFNKAEQANSTSSELSKLRTPIRLSKSLSDLQGQSETEVFFQPCNEAQPKTTKSKKISFFSDLKKKVYRTFSKSHFSRASVRRRFSVSVKNLFDNSRQCATEEEVEGKSDNNNVDVEVLYETLPAVTGSCSLPNSENEKSVEPKDLSCPKRPETSLAWEIFKLVKYGWYWGRLTPSEAEKRLESQPDGAFLVRDSSNDCHVLSLSFRSYGRTLHSRIEHSNGFFSLYGDSETRFGTVHELIFSFMERSSEGMFCFMRSRNPSPSMPVRLIKPISRFVDVLSLQTLCAYEIRQHVRMDNFDGLHIPERLKEMIYYPSMI